MAGRQSGLDDGNLSALMRWPRRRRVWSDGAVMASAAGDKQATITRRLTTPYDDNTPYRPIYTQPAPPPASNALPVFVARGGVQFTPVLGLGIVTYLSFR